MLAQKLLSIMYSDVETLLEKAEMLKARDRPERAEIYEMWAGRVYAFISFKEMVNESTELIISSNCVYSDSDREIINAANECVQKMKYSTFIVEYTIEIEEDEPLDDDGALVTEIESVEVASGRAFPIKVPGSKTVYFTKNKVPTIE